MTNTKFCASCLAETHTDTLLACTDGNRARIPARIFCATCGHFHGYAEAEPEPVAEAPPVFLAPITGPAGFVDALWKYAGRLAGGVW